MKNIHILVLEDSEDDLEFIIDTLKRADLKFTTERVDNKKDFEEALEKRNADLILSDHFLPQFNSTEALRMYREMELNIPFILVTGAISEEFAVTTLKQGADDYVLKSNLTRLPNAIVSAVQKRKAEAAKNEANNTLKKQYEELIKINKELDSFVYSVSHNLRAPLTSVMGLVHLAKLEDSKRDGYFNNYFTMVEDSMHKLDDTLKEILEYARNARQDLIIEEISMNSIIADNLERMQYMPGSSKILKDVIIDEQAPFYSDKYRLSVVVNNLVSNAIKYYDPTKDNCFLRIFIQINKERAVLEFEDNGIGIHANYIKKIFDMFFRATEKNNGDGLGLYIVHEAIAKLKGTIDVKSKIKEGTLFRIEIPNELIPGNTIKLNGKSSSVKSKLIDVKPIAR